jgi:hypothetical protein
MKNKVIEWVHYITVEPVDALRVLATFRAQDVSPSA